MSIKVNYKLRMPEEEIKRLSLQEFDEEYYGDFFGMFSLEANGCVFGHVEEEPTEIDFDFFEEWVLGWFSLMNDAVNELYKYGYSAVKVIEEMLSWLEFIETEEGFITIRYVSANDDQNETIKGRELTEVNEIYWSVNRIPLNLFYEEVRRKTAEILDYIYRLNPELFGSRYTLFHLIKKHRQNNENLYSKRKDK
ncbi:hypothetical protein [Paenibacillus sp. MSJ-34]|uniref:hypothetical protein n=1 Tax=Paenibacillus sp. MSJ-34 TaxID=2841529 RepID=UPI001C123DD6|nr:hypothetical protein [Paenibacillus sp. MSJ-34]MBU5442528.1 hypothetical protein [Paenibacillus sp. MSJ-34]